MFINLKSIIIMQSLIILTEAMHSPIRLNLENDQRQILASPTVRNQHHNLVIIVKQLASNHMLDLKELCTECHHFKKTYGRLPMISEAVSIALNLKKQYTRQEEISNDIMSYLFIDNDNLQSPNLEVYHHADSIVDHLGI
jgi:hypothetical protein